METKVCSKCAVRRPIDEFYVDRGRSTAACKPCRREQAKLHHHRQRERQNEARRQRRLAQVEREPGWDRIHYLWKTYRLTPEDYDRMLEEQGGVCGICSCEPYHLGLHVDHDHACCPGSVSCGACVRALLCPKCNANLASLEDSPWVRSAVDYLQRFLPPKPSPHVSPAYTDVPTGGDWGSMGGQLLDHGQWQTSPYQPSAEGMTKLMSMKFPA